MNQEDKLIRLTQNHPIKPFDCGDQSLNKFLFKEAKLSQTIPQHITPITSKTFPTPITHITSTTFRQPITHITTKTFPKHITTYHTNHNISQPITKFW